MGSLLGELRAVRLRLAGDESWSSWWRRVTTIMGRNGGSNDTDFIVAKIRLKSGESQERWVDGVWKRMNRTFCQPWKRNMLTNTPSSGTLWFLGLSRKETCALRDDIHFYSSFRIWFCGQTSAVTHLKPSQEHEFVRCQHATKKKRSSRNLQETTHRRDSATLSHQMKTEKFQTDLKRSKAKSLV